MLERADPRDVTPPRSDARSPLDAASIIPWSQSDDETLADPRAFPLYVDEVQRGFALECWMLGRPVMLSSGSDSDVSVADTAGRVDGLAIFPSPVLPAACCGCRDDPDGAVQRRSRRRSPSPRSRGQRRRMSALIDHLVGDHQYDDVAFVGRQEGFDNSERFREYRASLMRWGLRPRDEPIDGTVRGPHRMLEQLGALHARGALPRVLVCASDQHASWRWTPSPGSACACPTRWPSPGSTASWPVGSARRHSRPCASRWRRWDAPPPASSPAPPVRSRGQTRFDAVFAPRVLTAQLRMLSARVAGCQIPMDAA
jgi:hypothetical protein